MIMSITFAIAVIQNSVWVSKGVYNIFVWLLYGRQKSDVEVIKQKLEELQHELKDIKEEKCRQKKIDDIAKLSAFHDAVEQHLEQQRSSSTMTQSCRF